MLAGSSCAIRLRSWSSVGMVFAMGQRSMSGSPSKYIWVIKRCAQPVPWIEKWMWAGRQALVLLAHGYGPGLMVRKK
ncbi:hypothetical protein AAT18_11325 [Rhodococcus aetherivorans]|nr:hypothetical protein AAT18_11325 [Rhodococcus aetherivorans]